MQDQPPSPGDEPRRRRRITDEDAMVSRAVLGLVVSLHPGRLTNVELEQQLSKSPEDSTVERAVGDLVNAGLLERDGPYLMATRIALYLSRLGMTGPRRPPDDPESKTNGA